MLQARGGRLVFDLLHIFTFFKIETRPHKWCMENHVDFVEGQPIFDQALVTCEEGAAQAFVKFKHLSIAPAVSLNQVHWAVKVGNGH